VLGAFQDGADQLCNNFCLASARGSSNLYGGRKCERMSHTLLLSVGFVKGIWGGCRNIGKESLWRSAAYVVAKGVKHGVCLLDVPIKFREPKILVDAEDAAFITLDLCKSLTFPHQCSVSVHTIEHYSDFICVKVPYFFTGQRRFLV